MVHLIFICGIQHTNENRFSFCVRSVHLSLGDLSYIVCSTSSDTIGHFAFMAIAFLAKTSVLVKEFRNTKIKVKKIENPKSKSEEKRNKSYQKLKISQRLVTCGEIGERSA